MRLTDQFTISTPPERAFELLLDLRNVAPCVPGGEIEEPDEAGVFPGRVVVKLGPMKFTYTGTLQITEQDAASRTATIEGAGSAKGGGESARVRTVMQVIPEGTGSLVKIDMDLEIRGRAAQMGAGLLGTISKRMIEQTATCLEARLGEGA